MSDLFDVYTRMMIARGISATIRDIVDLFSSGKGEQNSPSNEEFDLHIAVLGPPRTGKSRLTEFLSTGSIATAESDYRKTLRPQINRVSVKQVAMALDRKGGYDEEKMQFLEQIVCVLHDLPGDDAYEEWKEALNASHLAFYLIRMDRLMEYDLEAEVRVGMDLKYLKDWTGGLEEGERPEIVFIGTHCDLTKPDLTTLAENRWEDYCTRAQELPVIRECLAAIGGGDATLVLGSMKSPQTTHVLLSCAFDTLFVSTGIDEL